MIPPTEETKRWVGLVEKKILEMPSEAENPSKKYSNFNLRIKIKELQMAKYLNHECSGRWHQLYNSLTPSENDKLPVKAILKAVFQCTNCKIKETMFLLKNGALLIGDAAEQPKMMHTPLGMANLPSREKHVKNGNEEEGFYVKKCDIKEILKYENPRKFLTNRQRREFDQQFPGVREDPLLKGKGNTKRYRSLINPGNSPYLDSIIPIIKEISGCHISMQDHSVSETVFSDLKDNERLATFHFFCRLVKSLFFLG